MSFSFNEIADWISLNGNLLLGATGETLYMVAVAGIVGFRCRYPTRRDSTHD